MPAVGVVSLEWGGCFLQQAVLYVERFSCSAPSTWLWLRIPTKKPKKIKEVTREEYKEYKVYRKKLRKEKAAQRRKPSAVPNHAAGVVARSAKAQSLGTSFHHPFAGSSCGGNGPGL